jgi:hypothetical protein
VGGGLAPDTGDAGGVTLCLHRRCEREEDSRGADLRGADADGDSRRDARVTAWERSDGVRVDGRQHCSHLRHRTLRHANPLLDVEAPRGLHGHMRVPVHHDAGPRHGVLRRR